MSPMERAEVRVRALQSAAELVAFCARSALPALHDGDVRLAASRLREAQRDAEDVAAAWRAALEAVERVEDGDA